METETKKPFFYVFLWNKLDVIGFIRWLYEDRKKEQLKQIKNSRCEYSVQLNKTN